MGKGIRFLVVWIVLFVGTVSVKMTLSERHELHQQYPTASMLVVNAMSHYQLTTQMRKWDRADQDEGPISDVSVSNAIVANRPAFLRCRDMIMAHSKRPKEFFEFSFVKNKPATIAGKTYTTLRDVHLERSTIGVSTPEETCLLSAMRDLFFEDQNIRPSRIFYEVCLGQKHEAT